MSLLVMAAWSSAKNHHATKPAAAARFARRGLTACESAPRTQYHPPALYRSDSALRVRMTAAESPAPPTRRLGALRLLWPFVKPHWLLAVGWLVFLATSSGATLVLPLAVRHVIDQGFSDSNAAAINEIFLGLFGVALVLAFATAARYFCITLLGERALASLRGQLYAHVVKLDVGFFERSRVGELISRLGTDTEVVQALVGSGISVALRSLVMLLGASAMMVWTSPRLAGLTGLVIPLVMVPILLFGRRVQNLPRASQIDWPTRPH